MDGCFFYFQYNTYTALSNYTLLTLDATNSLHHFPTSFIRTVIYITQFIQVK